MIEPQIIHENGKPRAIVLDYKEYLRLKELAEEREDYLDGIKALRESKKNHKHDEVKKKIGLE